MKIGYLSVGFAGLALFLSLVLSMKTVANARIRNEMDEFARLTEVLEDKLLSNRQLIQEQQDKINKGSAVSQSVGPAVLADIKSVAEKNNNLKLKDLLLKYGVRETGSSPAR